MSEEQSVNAAWGMPLSVFYCSTCRSAHLAPAEVTLAACPVCLQSAVLAQPEQMRRELPELTIPFAIGKERVNTALTEWSKGMWFRPDDLKPAVLFGRLRRYFLPLWLVDSDMEATWQAEMGYNYQAASFREQYAGGQWVSQEVTETRTRWEPRVGRLQRHYENVAVPALEEHRTWMSRLGGYDFRTRKPYSPHVLAETVVRVPDHAPDAAWMDAEIALNQAAAMECQVASEADHVRNWAMHAQYKNLNWTQMLVPAFVTFYQEAQGAYPIWINGQTGQIYGIKRMSQYKAAVASLVMGGIAILAFLLGLILSLVGAVLVLPLVLGVILILLSLLLGIAAPFPAVWVWFKNRNLERAAALR